MAGFIHDKLDIKLLVLYIMDRAAAPIDFATLTDLALCDEGVDYFQYAEESSLSPVVRQRCGQRLAPLNQALKRKAQVRARVEEAPQGFHVRLSMDDDQGSLFALTLLAPTREDAQRIADGFLDHPDRVYNGLLGVLLSGGEGRERH